jgi:hypothetical protein
LEAATGFEPVNNGFADRCLGHLAMPPDGKNLKIHYLLIGRLSRKKPVLFSSPPAPGIDGDHGHGRQDPTIEALTSIISNAF